MTQNTELSQRLESLIAQQREIQTEIEAITIEQSRIKSERRNQLNLEVEKIVERMSEEFRAIDRAIDLKVACNVFNYTIEIFSKYHKVMLCNFWYEESSLAEIERWAKKQMNSVHFYRALVDLDREEMLTATYYDRFSINVNDDIEIYPSYDPSSDRVKLEIHSIFSLKSIKNKLNAESKGDITFSNISVIDEDDYILDSTETRTCSFSEMIGEIRAIQAEKR